MTGRHEDLPRDPEDAPGGVPGVIAPDVHRAARLPSRAEAAAELEALAAWVDDMLAGGQPPKWVAQVGAAAARHIAARIRTGRGR